MPKGHKKNYIPIIIVLVNHPMHHSIQNLNDEFYFMITLWIVQRNSLLTEVLIFWKVQSWENSNIRWINRKYTTILLDLLNVGIASSHLVN